MRNKNLLSESKVHRCWRQMLYRCHTKTSANYDRYGGRGIKVCKRWHSFDCFIKDMGLPPSASHSLDRIDNLKGYSKDNCRWATSLEQGRNKRSNHFLTFKNKRMTISAWSHQTGIHKATIRGRINRGWSVSKTLTAPNREQLANAKR